MESSASPKSKGKKKWVVIGTIIVVIIIVGILASLPPGRTDLVQSGTVEVLQPAHYYGSQFTISSAKTIYGSASSTNGFVFYIMTPSSYSSWISNTSSVPSSYVYTSGQATSGSFNTNLASGTYYALFYNSASVNSTVTINDLYVT